MVSTKNDYFASFMVGVACGAFIMALVLIVCGKHPDDVYKQAQIDALTGKIKYELVVHPDKTSTWELKK